MNTFQTTLDYHEGIRGVVVEYAGEHPNADNGNTGELYLNRVTDAVTGSPVEPTAQEYDRLIELANEHATFNR